MKLTFARKIMLSAAVAVLFAGCATGRVNWNARVGSYTFDQAIVELGPPDKKAVLTDGKTVVEWISRYSNGGTVFIGAGIYGYPGGGYVQNIGPNYYESKLRLTFTTNNVLAGWSKD